MCLLSNEILNVFKTTNKISLSTTTAVWIFQMDEQFTQFGKPIMKNRHMMFCKKSNVIHNPAFIF